MHTKKVTLRGNDILVTRIAWIDKEGGRVGLEHPVDKNARTSIPYSAFYESNDDSAKYGAGVIKRFLICEGDFIEITKTGYPVRNLGGYRSELPF